MYIVRIYLQENGKAIGGMPIDTSDTANTVCVISDSFLHNLISNNIFFKRVAYLKKYYTNDKKLDDIFSKSGFYFQCGYFNETFDENIDDLKIEGKYYLLKENSDEYTIWEYNRTADDLVEVGALTNNEATSEWYTRTRTFQSMMKKVLDINEDEEYLNENNNYYENKKINELMEEFHNAIQNGGGGGTGGSSNINSISVNGTKITPDKNKNVNIKVPTKVTDLKDSDDYAKKTDIPNIDVKAEIDKWNTTNNVTKNIEDTYRKSEIDERFKDYSTTEDIDNKFNDYYKSTDADEKLTNLTSDLKNFINSEESLGLKTVLFSDNTLKFFKKSNALESDTADFIINLPEEKFLDQTKTVFIDNFIWNKENYPDSSNPNLDGQSVLVLAVKGDKSVNYSFISITNNNKADKLSEDKIKENQILIDDGNGNINGSGKTISDLIPENKDILDNITQEDINKWNSAESGSSYTSGEGISISDDNIISTNFTNLSEETSINNKTNFVSSELKTASLNDIGSLIKDDQSLVTKEELDLKIQKAATSIKYGKQYVTNDYSSDAYNSIIKDLNNKDHSFLYTCPYCNYTIYWNDDNFNVDNIALGKYIDLYTLNNDSSTPSLTFSRMNFNDSYLMKDVSIIAPIHYDNYGHLGAIFAYRRILNSTTLGAVITGQFSPFDSYLNFKSLSIFIKDSSWDTSKVQEIISTIDANISMISEKDSSPYKLFISFSYNNDDNVVKKSFIYEGDLPSDFTIEYNNETDTFVQSSGTIKNIYLDQSVYQSSTYFTPVKFNDIWIMARTTSNSEKVGTPIMYSEDGGKTWQDTSYIKDVPEGYQDFDKSHISFPSVEWTGPYVFCKTQLSIVNDIILCNTNDTVVYSKDGKTWHPAFYIYSDDNYLGYFTGSYETKFISLSNNRITYVNDISEETYVYSNYSNGEYSSSSSQQSGCYPVYSDDGMIFRIAKFKKSDDTYISQIESSAIIIGPKINNILTGHINGYSQYYEGYENNVNKSYLPVYSDDNGETWQVGKMYDIEGNDVTLTDTVNHSLYSYHFYGSDDILYMLNDRDKTSYHYYTIDGISWKPIKLPVDSCYITRISYTNNMYFATYSNYTSDSIFFYSEDGINFSNTSIDESSSEFYNSYMNRSKFDGYKMSNIVRYTNDKYFIGINYGYAYSNDGKIWTVKSKNFNNGNEPYFNTPIYIDGNYVVTFKEPTSSMIMAYSPDLIEWNIVGCPIGPNYETMKGIPFLMDNHIAVWSIGSSQGVGVISDTEHKFDIISTKIIKGDFEELYAYSYTYCGYYNETISRYLILTDNPSSTNYPYQLYYSLDGINFTKTKMTCKKYPHTLYGDCIGGNGRVYFGDYYMESERQGSSNSSYIKMDYTGISYNDIGGIMMMTDGKCIGFSYKYQGHYSDNYNNNYQSKTYKNKIIINDIYGGIYTVHSNGYSYKGLPKYSSSTIGNINDFILSSDESYIVYVSDKGIFYYDISKETLDKASCIDKSNNDVTNDSLNYKYVIIIGKGIYVYGKPDSVSTEGRYFVSSSLILQDDNSLILSEAKSYTDSKVDDTSTDLDKVWSANKVNNEISNITSELSLLPFKWELIGTSAPDTSDETSNIFNKEMTSGLPFCVFHVCGVFCFGNGTNPGKLFGNTTGSVCLVTFDETTKILNVSVGSGKAYIYQMKLIEN